jgi:hypothetical protein
MGYINLFPGWHQDFASRANSLCYGVFRHVNVSFGQILVLLYPGV